MVSPFSWTLYFACPADMNESKSNIGSLLLFCFLSMSSLSSDPDSFETISKEMYYREFALIKPF